MRVAVAEDDEACRLLLERYLAKYHEATGTVFEVSFFSNGMELVKSYTPVYDLLLLDIEMPLLDGMSAAIRIRSLDQNVIIIFITNMAKYAIRGYEVNALDYMLKPVNYFAFAMKMDKVVLSIQRQTKKSVMLCTDDGMVKLTEEDIAYVEVINHRLQIHTPDKVYNAKGTLSEFEKKVSPYHFVRCNKGYLVNLRHITRVRTGTVVVGGDELIISRRKRDEFMLAVTDYYGSGGK